MIDTAAIRADFPVLARQVRGEPLIYLDSAATSQRPIQVIEAERDFYLRLNAAVHRGTHALGEEATDAYEAARDAVSQFVGGGEIVWTKNATEALNLVAYALQNTTLDGGPLALREGDEIVITEAEHHANLVPWQQLARRTGATLKWLGLTDDGQIDLSTLDRITERTRVVAFTHVSNVTGAISPVAEIVKAARAVGALIVLDACQSVPHMPVNLLELGVDVAAFSAHKMLGPTGVGALWARPGLLDQFPPFITGGSMVEVVTMENTTFLPPPARFEAGSQATAQVAAWTAAVEYLERIGMANIAEHEAELTAHCVAGITQIEGVRLLGPTKGGIGVVAFDVDGVHPHDVSQFLDAGGIEVRAGHHCAQPIHRRLGVRSSSRASFGVHTTPAEIDAFLDRLSEVRRYFGVIS